MRNPRKVTPRLETMESLTLLSGVGVAPATSHAAVETTMPAAAALHGSMRGTIEAHRLTTNTNGDGSLAAGTTTYDIRAAGTVTPIGAAEVTGSLAIGYDSHDVSVDGFAGTLQLATSRGTLTLDVPASFAYPTGLPRRTSPHEIVITYAIDHGTEAYAGLAGTGVVEFTAARGGTHGDLAGDGRLGIRFTHLDQSH